MRLMARKCARVPSYARACLCSRVHTALPRTHKACGCPYAAAQDMNSFSDSVTTALGLVVSGDAALWAIVLRSLAVSATACLLACGLGLLLGAWLAVARFPGQ